MNRRLALMMLICVAALFLLPGTPAFAQAASEHDWTVTPGGVLADEGVAVAASPDGSIVVVGTFQGSVDFDPGPGVKILTSQGSTDSFLMKLEEDGSLRWALSFGGSEATLAKDLAVDINGDIFVVGSYSGFTDFDPGPLQYVRTSNGSTDIFFQRFNSEGKLIWAASVGSDESDEGEAVFVDVRHNLYLTGSFEEIMDVNLDPAGDSYWLDSEGNDDVFVLRYTNDGSILRGWSFGGSSDATGMDIVVDDLGNVFIAGEFEGKVDFAPGEDYVVRSAGKEDIFVVKYDDAGYMRWTGTFGGTREERDPAIAMDKSGNIYLTGGFHGQADFEPGDGELFLRSVGERDIFLLKMNRDRLLTWVHTIGGIRSDYGADIVTGLYGDIFVTGTFEESVDFDPGPGTTILNGIIEEDAFLARYSTEGTLYSAQAMSGPQEENGYGVALGGSNDVYVTGGFESTVNFNVGAEAQNRTAAGASDIFVTKRQYPTNPFGTDPQYLPFVVLGSITQ